MATTIDSSIGKKATVPTRVVKATVDFTAVTSYATGGHAITEITAEIVGLTFVSVPLPHYDGSATRYFTVNATTGKVQSWENAGAVTETTATQDLKGHTAIPVLLIGQ